MRSEANDAPFQPATPSRILAVTVALLMALCSALLLSATASALEPAYKGFFKCAPTPGTPTPGQVEGPCEGATTWAAGRLAVNEETGDVYVIDEEPDLGAIRIFDADGNYKDSILGSDITDGTASFGFGGIVDIAIDNSGGERQGYVYVASEQGGPGTLFAFDADGNFKWRTSEFVDLCGVAVDASGNPFSSGYGDGVQQRNTEDGSAVGSPIVTSADASDTCQIAFDSQNNLYLRRFDSNSVVQLLASNSFVLPGKIFHDDSLDIEDIEVDRDRDRIYVLLLDTARYFEADGTEISDSPSGSDVGGRHYAGIGINSKTGKIYISDLVHDDIEIFNPPAAALQINKVGLGSIKCEVGDGPEEACASSYPEGTEVTLKAVADPGSTFVSFSGGGCTVSPCTLTLNADTTVTATFNVIKHELTLIKAGNGAATSSLNCKIGAGSPGPCAAKYNEGATVTVIASPGPHIALASFTGACSSVPCNVLIDADKTVTATFTKKVHTLSVATIGSGSVSCKIGAGAPGTCASSYDEGTQVTLVASAGSGSSFAGWSGAGCSGTGDCAINLEGDAAVTATFNKSSEGGTTPPPPPGPTSTFLPPSPNKPVKCKKGFKRKKVKGKQKCVKIKKHAKKNH